MKFSRVFLSTGVAAGLFCACLFQVQDSRAQTATPSKGAASKNAKSPPKKAEVKRPPLSQAEVQSLWAQKDQTLLLNEIRLRGLAFEPEEDWVAHLPNVAEQPLAIAELRKLIPPAPDVDTVAAQAPDLLNKLRDASQKRDEIAFAALVHPELLANKARAYDLFDTANYRSHALGRFAPAENRRVGVQFFQLTTNQVERLHYVMFSNYGGKLVVRDIVTGPAVADRFLHDEEQLALSKLDLVFRALNDGDATGLRALCTPGLYESLEPLGSVFTPGKSVPLDRISRKASVSLDQKSVRVVVRVGYAATSGRQVQYDVDFERVDKDLKVVRIRDVQGGVIAWDPDIDNYLNRRYGLPDGPQVKDIAQSDVPDFYPLPTIRTMAMRAVEVGDARKLKDFAELMIAREPTSGEGYGIRAAFQHAQGNFDEAGRDATTAIDRGGVAYFGVLEYSGSFSHQFSTGVLGISKDKIQYFPTGAAREEIELAAVKAAFDGSTSNRGSIIRNLMGSSGGPFFKVEVTRQKKKTTYTFAALGTVCRNSPQAAARRDLEPYPNGVFCGSEGANVQSATAIPLLVPRQWLENLRVVADAIEHAKTVGAPAKR
jgi:hypothetical protein